MVDKKTGLKPKAPRAQKLETSNKELVKRKIKEEKKAAPSEVEAKELVPIYELPVTAEPSTQLAKAGKHSAKAIAEAEAEQARHARKIERQAKSAKAEGEGGPKILKKPTRPKAERAGKKYREVFKLVDKSRTYPLEEALQLATKTSPTKFDSSVELHINLGVDPKQADHNIRGTVSLPAGTGKKIRVAVFAEGDEAGRAKNAGADLVGSEELLAALDKEQIEFDILITTPSLMPKLGKYARLLGPKGLMPNPKSGSITTDIAGAIAEAKAGQVEFRVDPAGIVHLAIGKVSFGPEKLSQNAQVVLGAIKAAKPASIKGVYIKSIYTSTTMGPSIPTEMPS